MAAFWGGFLGAAAGLFAMAILSMIGGSKND